LTGGARIPVGIVGASGYGGAETARWLLRHPRFALAAATSRRSGGKRLAEVHEFLEGATDLVVTDEDVATVAKRVEALVFSLPHGEAARLVPAALESNPSVRVLDLSGDFRLDDAAAWERAYGMPHPAPALLPRFIYGFPEAHRRAVERSQCVSNPGCFATGAEIALFPLACRGLLKGEAVVFSVTGSSGSGAEPSPVTHHPERAQDFRAYKVLEHQHVPEIERLLRESGAADPRVSMIPHSGPFVRGLFTSAAVLLEAGTDAAALEGLVREVYEGEPFVRVRKGTPRVAVVEGTNFADVSVHVRGNRAVILSAIDNLGKGMASQAVQNLNTMFRIPETEGILDYGHRP
jgi:N-acetyl-gamma-glutamyl-phosphate reductase